MSSGCGGGKVFVKGVRSWHASWVQGGGSGEGCL